MDGPANAHDTQPAAMQQEAARQAIAQIAHLAQTWPIKRSWLPLNNRITSAAAAASTTTTSSTRTSSPLLTLVSYNLLAQHLIRRKMFMYCSKDTLRLHHRRQQLTAELLSYQADILALQEVDADLYHEHYQAVLGSHGYDGRFGTADDKGHGCALFFKRDRFDVADYELMQYADMAKEYDDEQTHNEMNKANIAQILTLTLKPQPNDAAAAATAAPAAPLGLIVTNTHLYWHPPHRFVRLRQCERLLSRTAAVAHQHKLPALLAGDWNLTPATHIYHWLIHRRLERQFWYKYIRPADENKGAVTAGSKPEDERWDATEEKTVMELEQQHSRYVDMQRLLDRSQSLPLLASAYSSYTSLVPPLPPQPYCDWQGEPPYTNYTGGWKGTLDYVFVLRHTAEQQQQQSSAGGVEVEVESVLELPGLEVVNSATALPNDTLGSDHLAIGCQFRLISG